ncbi:hypothetical protein H6503_03725 [Candidatus Woesearchaeota archaeon]|nr:hypothetical protein [Candidatus Woesearchaeota archaeon]
MKKVVIIGANHSGLHCAMMLDPKKFDVTIIDMSKNPGEKYCAGGTSSKSNKYIPERFRRRLFTEVFIQKGVRRARIERKNNPLYTIDRPGYINYLINKAKKKGIKIILGKKIGIDDIGKKDVAGFDYDILIGADGTLSVVRRKLGLESKRMGVIEAKTKPMKDMEFFFDKRFGNGYFWIFPHDTYSSIGCTGGLQVFSDFCKEKGLEFYDKVGFSIQYKYCGYDFGDKYLIGEAAGLVSEITGEGIYAAIVSGEGLAKELNTGKKSEEIAHIVKQLKWHNSFTYKIILILLPVLLILPQNAINKITDLLSVK